MVIKGNMNKELEYFAKLPYTVIVEQWDDGEGPYWVARIAELPHCLIHADTPFTDICQWHARETFYLGKPDRGHFSSECYLRFTKEFHKFL
ncbi:hypothetical protein ES703_125679 [subsurface metagenome]